MPEIHRLSSLYGSFLIFGLEEDSEADNASAADASTDPRNASADDQTRADPLGRRPIRGTATAAVEAALFWALCEQPHPLHSNPVRVGETSYASYLTSHPGPAPRIPQRNPSRRNDPRRPDAAAAATAVVAGAEQELAMQPKRFNPLTVEDSPSGTPDQRGDGYRYPAFFRSQEQLSLPLAQQLDGVGDGRHAVVYKAWRSNPLTVEDLPHGTPDLRGDGYRYPAVGRRREGSCAEVDGS